MNFILTITADEMCKWLPQPQISERISIQITNFFNSMKNNFLCYNFRIKLWQLPWILINKEIHKNLYLQFMLEHVLENCSCFIFYGNTTLSRRMNIM